MMKKLLEIMARLRDPDSGCPWDCEQDFASLIPFTLEEAYEVADAIDQQDFTELRDELGDLLFQIVFYAQMAREQNLFEFNDVVNAISEKLIRRHPHVFADEIINSVDDQTAAWEEHKRQERNKKSDSEEPASELDGITRALPALTRAQKIQRRASRAGFDWDNVEPVYEKVVEELQEVREASQQQDQDALEDEVGDLLFAGVNLARFHQVDAENALRKATFKFEKRFRAVERIVADQGLSMSTMSVPQLEEVWDQVKATEKRLTTND